MAWQINLFYLFIARAVNMNKKIKRPIGHLLMFIILILFIAVIFLTVGWAANKLLREDQPRDLGEKKKRLKEVEDKIMDLQAKKEEIRLTEKRILLLTRLLIALGLLLANYFYMKYYKLPFSIKKSSNEMLRFNSVVLLIYSFIAFVTYGTPAKFVDSLKSIVTLLLRRFNMDTYSSFELLLHERNVLLIDIEEKSKDRKGYH